MFILLRRIFLFCAFFPLLGVIGCGDESKTSPSDTASDTSRDVMQLTARGDHTCALLGNGSVKCWGDNYDGQLGLGDEFERGNEPGELGESLPAVDFGGSSALTISAGNSHTCAILDDGAVTCWGYNDEGQLGLGYDSYGGNDPNEMGINLERVDLGTNVDDVPFTAVAIAAGNEHTCAILNDGGVKCWGENNSGQVGMGEDGNNIGNRSGEMGNNLPKVNLGIGRTAIALAAGSRHSCALLDNGSIKCWGENGSGQLGLGDNDDTNVATRAVHLGLGVKAVQIAAGGNYSCALLESGDVKCWGNNENGQLGNEDTEQNLGISNDTLGDNIPVLDFGDGRTAVALAAAYNHACAVLDDGSVTCWGSNDNAELGIGELSDGPVLPGGVVDLGTGRTAVSVATGEYHSCALLDDHSVKCWGLNDDGRLGIADDKLALRHIVDIGEVTVAHVYAGANHSCVLLDNGNVKCWGGNDYGELGLGDTDYRGDNTLDMGSNVPAIDLGDDLSAKFVGNGTSHTCVIIADSSDGGELENQVKCWGGDWTGQLGIDATSDSIGDDDDEMGNALLAVELGDGLSAHSLSVGANFNCVILADSNDGSPLEGQVMCWGDNWAGALGTDEEFYTSEDVPSATVDLGDGLSAKVISAGESHACAIIDDSNDGEPLEDQVKCWGLNDYRQLGLDSDDWLSAPVEDTVDLGSGRSAVAIEAGARHTCALLDNDTVKCWGANYYGQLGLGYESEKHDGDMADLPTVDLGDETPVSLSSKDNHVCVMFVSGASKCWGNNNDGQLGVKNVEEVGVLPEHMGNALQSPNIGEGRSISEISTGVDYTCIVDTENQVSCWGSNSYEKLGLGNIAYIGDEEAELGDGLLPVSL